MCSCNRQQISYSASTTQFGLILGARLPSDGLGICGPKPKPGEINPEVMLDAVEFGLGWQGWGLNRRSY